MNIMQSTDRHLLRRLLFIASLFALFIISSCEREPLAGPQPLSEQPDLESLRIPEVEKDRQIATVKLDDDFRKALETRMADYRAELALSPKAKGLVKSGVEITVPDPDAGIYTIQDGVDAAPEGGKVKVQSGEYTEEVMIVTPGVEVKADGAVRLNGNFTIDADGVVIKGFEIINTAFASILGINASDLEASGNTVSGGYTGITFSSATGSIIKDNKVSGVDFGIVLADYLEAGPSAGNTIKNNMSTGNTFSGIILQDNSSDNTVVGNTCNEMIEYGGIILVDSHSNIIKGNICNNSLWPSDGIALYSSTGNVIKDNTCNGNEYSGIGVVYGSAENQVSDNVCKNNGLYGVYLLDASENQITGNACNNNERFGIRLNYASENVIGPNNEASNNVSAGIGMHNSNNNTIRENVCHANVYSGIAVSSYSNSNVVYGNSCKFGGHIGIDLFRARENQIGPDNEASENGTVGVYLAYNTGDNSVSGNSAINNNSCDLTNYGESSNTQTNNTANCITGF